MVAAPAVDGVEVFAEQEDAVVIVPAVLDEEEVSQSRTILRRWRLWCCDAQETCRLEGCRLEGCRLKGAMTARDGGNLTRGGSQHKVFVVVMAAASPSHGRCRCLTAWLGEVGLAQYTPSLSLEDDVTGRGEEKEPRGDKVAVYVEELAQ